ncbi:hypothetical protein [Pantoea sp. C2G6]|uniref:hypothetical protein n=1 Tax=Pantoea sp. C2G6 TaxID=3243084 RepID=UPI003EDAC48B
MRNLTTAEQQFVSGASLDAATVQAMFAALGDVNSPGFFANNKSRIEKEINQVGLATVDTSVASGSMLGSKMGDAGWQVNIYGQTVKWFNNGMFFAFDIC